MNTNSSSLSGNIFYALPSVITTMVLYSIIFCEQTGKEKEGYRVRLNSLLFQSYLGVSLQ